MSTVDKQLLTKLNKIADLINETHGILVAEYGKGSTLYFEADGAIHAMKPEESFSANASARQALVVATSKHCTFDCGGW